MSLASTAEVAPEDEAAPGGSVAGDKAARGGGMSARRGCLRSSKCNFELKMIVCDCDDYHYN